MVEEHEKGFLIKQDNGWAYWQRKEPTEISHDALTNSEIIILQLCKANLKL